jgi:LysM repeat protein
MTRVRRLLAGLGALVVLAVLVGGVPIGLVVGIGWPLPHALPDWTQLQVDLSTPIPDAALIKALACVVWAGWAILAAAVAAEAAAAIRGHAARRLPVAGALQPFAGHLVAAVAFALVSLTLRPTTAAPAPLSAVLLTATHPPAATAAPAAPPAGQASSSPATHRVSGALTTTTPPDATAGRVYVVRRGDTLWGIAAAQLGDPLRWRAIYALNNGRPQPDGAVLTDPNDIWPGWTLILPADASPPPIATASPNGSPADPTDSRASVPARPPAPVVNSSPAAPTPPATTASAATPPQSPSAPIDTRPAPPAHHQPETERAHASPAPVVELPSGSAVALGVAAAIGAALALARLQQRRRYRPGHPRPGLVATEPLAGPTVRRLRRAHLDLLDARDTATAGPAQPCGTPEQPAAPDLPPGCVPAGQRAGAPLVLDLLTHPGAGLTGPGAEGTARGLAVALLADTGAHRAELLTTAETARLLGPGDTGGVDVATDLADALGRLEVELVHRTRLLDAHDAVDLAALAAGHPEEPLGPLVLLATAPPLGSGQRLAAVLTLGQRLGIGAILLGAWPTGLTLTVATDGTVEHVAGGRAAELDGAQLGTLTETEAAELLGVLAAARPGPQPEAVSSEKAAPESPSEKRIEPPPEPERAGVARPVELRLLGPVRILAGGDEIDTGLRSKARELLAYLATRPQGVSDETVVDAIWPDAPPGRAHPALRHRGVHRFHPCSGRPRPPLGGHKTETVVGSSIAERDRGGYDCGGHRHLSRDQVLVGSVGGGDRYPRAHPPVRPYLQVLRRRRKGDESGITRHEAGNPQEPGGGHRHRRVANDPDIVEFGPVTQR